MVSDRLSLSGSPRRALLGLAALVLLLGVVAVASTGSVPVGSGGARKPSDRVLDVLLSLFLLAMTFGVLLWGYILLIRRSVVAEAAAARRQRSPWVSLVGFALVVFLLAVLVIWFSVDDALRRRFADRTGTGLRDGAGGDPGAAGDYRPEFATGPVLVIVGLLATAAGAWYLSHRARRSRLQPLPDSLLPALADVLEETLDDLRAERDPRRAVIAAYARMERALAAYGLPRSPAEAPDEYLHRILADLAVSRKATSRLTALFSRARFSTHDVVPEMKQEAIDALVAVREELRAAEILAADERARSTTELQAKAAR